MNQTSIVKKATFGAFDLLGPTVEFLSSPRDSAAAYCVMVGTIPAGGYVPLHSHADVESFYVLSGSVQVWCDDAADWRQASEGLFVHVPGGLKHASRNTSAQPVIEVIATTRNSADFC